LIIFVNFSIKFIYSNISSSFSYQLIYHKGYQENDTALSVINTKVKGLGFTELNEAIINDMSSYLGNEVETASSITQKIIFDNAGKFF